MRAVASKPFRVMLTPISRGWGLCKKKLWKLDLIVNFQADGFGDNELHCRPIGCFPTL